MKAMILAAGHGTRMRPLTEHTPKPLLRAGGKPLIVWHIEKLAAAGYEDIIINLGWLGDQIPQALGYGSQWGVKLHYSDEQAEGVLETAGGIIKALPLLGDDIFLVVNGDVWSDYPCLPLALAPQVLAHLILVDNPVHHPQGDFGLQQGQVVAQAERRFTFSGIAYYHPRFFAQICYGKQALLPLFQRAMQQQQQLSGEHYTGWWMDIGTPQRLQELDQHLITTIT